MARVPGDRDFRWLFDATVEAMMLADIGGAILARNPSCERIFGYAGHEWAGLAIEDLVPAGLRAAHRHYRTAYAVNPVSRPMGRRGELRGLRKDGSEFPARVSLSVLPDVEGPLILAIVEDISTQRQAEEALHAKERQLREREALLALAVRATGLAPWAWNPSTGAVCLSPEWKLQVGYADEEVDNDPAEWRSRLHPDDVRPLDAVGEQFASGERREAEVRYRLRHRDGCFRWMQSKAVLLALPDDGGERVLGLQWDVTEQVSTAGQVGQWRTEEGHLRQLQVALETAATIAHELNQPLNAVVSFSEAAQLMGRHGKTDKLDYALASAVAQAERAGEVVHNLLRFLERQELPTMSVDLGRVAREAVALVAADGASGCRIALSVAPSLPLVQGNELQIKKVLANLLRNSAEALAAAGLGDGAIEVTVGPAEGGMVQVSVKDSGPGPDPATVGHIFEPFFTTKPRGIGMSLATSRRIVGQLGGRIWFDASDGGPAFHFTLPLAP